MYILDWPKSSSRFIKFIREEIDIHKKKKTNVSILFLAK